MSFENGTTALLICPMFAKMPDNFLEKFAFYRAGRLDEVEDEPVTGWVSGRHLLETEINESTCICGANLYLNLRKAERKIPSQLLNAICKRDELALMQEQNKIVLTRKEKAAIKAKAIENNLMKMPPTISATACLVDLDRKVLYFGGSSLSAYDNFLAEFSRAVSVEPAPLSPTLLMSQIYGKTESDIPQMDIIDSKSAEDEALPGRDFLTWLWFKSEVDPHFCKLGDYGELSFSVQGPLTFAYSPFKSKDPELVGAAESTVKKGNPMASVEAQVALKSGKKLRKAKIVLSRNDVEKWTFSFDADTFAFSGLSLPEGEEMELNERLKERVEFLHILHLAIEESFKQFVDSLSKQNISETLKNIRAWMDNRYTEEA